MHDKLTFEKFKEFAAYVRAYRSRVCSSNRCSGCDLYSICDSNFGMTLTKEQFDRIVDFGQKNV